MKKVLLLMMVAALCFCSCKKDDPVAEEEQKKEQEQEEPTAESNLVDLGLSVKWAKCNLGASNPEEYGLFFAWGDVVGQRWDGTKWSGSGFDEYCKVNVDKNMNLEPQYDAAHVMLGENYRMPTLAEVQELVKNCNCTWTNVNGVNGMVFTSKVTGYSDKSIFLPAAGYGCEEDLCTEKDCGYYWTSTFDFAPDESTAFSNNLTFDKTGAWNSNYYSYTGHIVRPVSE